MLYATTTKTLFCGDLFTWNGPFVATTDADIVVGHAVQAEDETPGSLPLHPSSGATCRRVAELDIETVARCTPRHARATAGPRSSTSPRTSTAASTML